MEAVSINRDTYRIEDGFVRSFLLIGAERALLIDTGASSAEAKSVAESLTALPLLLANTHSDGDHVAGNGEFAEFYMHEADWESCGGAQRFPASKCLPLTDGMTLSLGERDVEIISVPGHTAGSVALLDKRDRALIAGDSVQTEHIYMFGPSRRCEAFEGSLEKLLSRRGDYDTVYASHGESVLPATHVQKVLDAWRQLRAGKLEGREQNMFGNTIVTYEADGCGFFCGK